MVLARILLRFPPPHLFWYGSVFRLLIRSLTPHHLPSTLGEPLERKPPTGAVRFGPACLLLYLSDCVSIIVTGKETAHLRAKWHVVTPTLTYVASIGPYQALPTTTTQKHRELPLPSLWLYNHDAVISRLGNFALRFGTNNSPRDRQAFRFRC